MGCCETLCKVRFFYNILSNNWKIILYFILIKNQNLYEANLGKDFNNIYELVPNKTYVEENNCLNVNNREQKKLQQKSNEFTLTNNINKNNNVKNYKNNDSINNLNINKSNKNELITSSIDDKYKNFENPFTPPEIEKKKEKEAKNIKIMNRINKGREKAKSHSVENAKYKKSDEIQKLADNLGKHLFKEDNNHKNIYD